MCTASTTTCGHLQELRDVKAMHSINQLINQLIVIDNSYLIVIDGYCDWILVKIDTSDTIDTSDSSMILVVHPCDRFIGIDSY